MVEAFEPVGLYDESSVFIDGIYAVKRQKGDYDLVRDQTGETMAEVKHSLEMDSSGHVVPRNVVRDEEEYVVLLHKSKKPYPFRQCKIENMCGIFAALLYKDLLKGACVFTSTVFGMNHEMYHTEGNVTVVRNKAFFKGCRYEPLLIFFMIC